MAGFPKAYVHYDVQSITWIGAFSNLFVRSSDIRNRNLRSVENETLRRNPHSRTTYFDRSFTFSGAGMERKLTFNTLNDTYNVSDKLFAIFQKTGKAFNMKFLPLLNHSTRQIIM